MRMFRWRSVRISILAATAFVGCGRSPTNEADGGVDGSSPSVDAGAPTDAGGTADAGGAPDAGGSTDGSVTTDAGATGDGGIGWDEPAPPCSGVFIPPGLDTLQGPIADAGPGAAFCLDAGVYRLSFAAKLKQNQSVMGAGAALTFIYGSAVLSGWVDAGSAWVVDLSLPDGGSALDGTVLDLNADFAPPQPPLYWGADSYNFWFDHSRGDTFYGGQRLARVGELWDGGVSPVDAGPPTAVAAGQLFVDYDRHLVYVGSDPASAQVEIALAPTAFAPQSAAATGVTLAYFAVQRFGNQIAAPGEEPIQSGANWTVHHVDGSYNHGPALRQVSGLSLSHSRFVNNGSNGSGGGMVGGLIDSVDWELNNKEIRSETNVGAGGVKFGSTRDVVVRNSIASRNYGPGIWFDVGSRFVVVQDNIVQDNVSQGIRQEIGFECVIRDNVVSGNSGVFAGDKGDIVIAASGAADVSVYPLDGFWVDAGFGNSIEIYGNVIAVGDAGEPAVLLGQGPRYQATEFDLDGGLHVLRNVHVHDNTMMLAGTRPMVELTNALPADAGVDPWDAGSTFLRNAYVTGGECAKDLWSWGGASLSFAGWQDAGQDPGPAGSCN
jgi:hypothetical protein